MLKLAGLEDSDMSDPKTGKKIRISTTVRLIYRKAYPDVYGSMRNSKLNIVIAKDFIKNSNNVLHYFRLGSKGQSRTEYKPPGHVSGEVYANVAEIRGSTSSYFISALKDNSIDILTIQASWLKPRYMGSSEKPIALGDS